MKKFLVWVLIVLLLPLSYVSYRLLERHTIRFQFFTNTLPNQIVPDNEIELSRTQALQPLAKPVILFISNHSFVTPENSFFFEEKSQENGSLGYYPVYPVLDPDISLVNFLSGVSPHRGGYLSKPLLDTLDSLLLSAKDSGLKTAYFGNHIPYNPEEIETEAEIEETYSEPYEQKELKIPASYVEPIQSVADIQRWLEEFQEKLFEFDLLIFNIPPINNPANEDVQNDYIESVNQVMENIYQTFQDESQYFYTSPLSFASHNQLMLSPNPSFEVPVYCFGKSLQKTQKPFHTQLENISSTLCFSLGISPPQENITPPLLAIYQLPEDEIVNRYSSFLNGQMMSYMKVLLSYGINEETVSGYILHVNNSIHETPIQGLGELQTRIDLLQNEFYAFIHTQNDKTRKQELIFFILMIAIAGILWLSFLMWNWRGYLYGFIFIAVYYSLNTFVFQNSYIFPPLHSITFGWVCLTYGIPLLLTSIVCSILATVFGGYFFDIDLSSILQDLNGLIGTFGVFLIIHSGVIGIMHGYTFTGTLDSFPTQQLFLQNEALLFMLPASLLLMFGIALLLHWLLAKNQRKKDANEKTA
ncbi:MAG TPA: hypothetical protein PLE09_02365 [Caldisericia bacterium]|jgi:hypothetical protein|nr:hypothetical protein [Caldisericia bacterium]HXK51383.1 hypothetical protein [Caldisericia bacterium]